MYEEESPDAVSYGRGGICVNVEPYKKKIFPPTPKELIDMTAQELEQILKINTTKSPRITMEDSHFIAYSAEVSSFAEINSVYRKIKLIQPDAKHVVCAYSLSSSQSNEELCYQMDYQDDGEPSAGRFLLDLLNQHSLKQRAIFVARIYGGRRMGIDRFKCYLRAAKLALGIDIPDPDQPEAKPPPSFTKPVNRDRAQFNNNKPRGGRGRPFKRGSVKSPYAPSSRGLPWNSNRGSTSFRGAKPASTQSRNYRSQHVQYADYGTDPDFRHRVGLHQFNFSDPWRVPTYQSQQ